MGVFVRMCVTVRERERIQAKRGVEVSLSLSLCLFISLQTEQFGRNQKIRGYSSEWNRQKFS